VVDVVTALPRDHPDHPENLKRRAAAADTHKQTDGQKASLAARESEIVRREEEIAAREAQLVKIAELHAARPRSDSRASLNNVSRAVSPVAAEEADTFGFGDDDVFHDPVSSPTRESWQETDDGPIVPFGTFSDDGATANTGPGGRKMSTKDETGMVVPKVRAWKRAVQAKRASMVRR